MKTVNGTVLSSKPIDLSKAAKILSKFASSDNGASPAFSAYLRRASASFNELVQIRKELKIPGSGHKSKKQRAEGSVGGKTAISVKKQPAEDGFTPKEKKVDSGRKNHKDSKLGGKESRRIEGSLNMDDERKSGDESDVGVGTVVRVPKSEEKNERENDEIAKYQLHGDFDVVDVHGVKNEIEMQDGNQKAKEKQKKKKKKDKDEEVTVDNPPEIGKQRDIEREKLEGNNRGKKDATEKNAGEGAKLKNKIASDESAPTAEKNLLLGEFDIADVDEVKDEIESQDGSQVLKKKKKKTKIDKGETRIRDVVEIEKQGNIDREKHGKNKRKIQEVQEVEGSLKTGDEPKKHKSRRGDSEVNIGARVGLQKSEEILKEYVESVDDGEKSLKKKRKKESGSGNNMASPEKNQTHGDFDVVDMNEVENNVDNQDDSKETKKEMKKKKKKGDGKREVVDDSTKIEEDAGNVEVAELMTSNGSKQKKKKKQKEKEISGIKVVEENEVGTFGAALDKERHKKNQSDEGDERENVGKSEIIGTNKTKSKKRKHAGDVGGGSYDAEEQEKPKKKKKKSEVI